MKTNQTIKTAMKFTQNISPLLISAFWALNLAAQPERNVGNIEINVVEQYRANIKQAAKISRQPDFADSTTVKLPVNYSINPQMLVFDYQPQTIQPVKVTGVRLPKLPTSLVRIGGGNYTTSLAEVLIGSSRAQGFSWDVGLRHFGSRAGVKDIIFDNNPFYENAIYGDLGWVKKDYRLKAKIGADWNINSFYGIPEIAGEGGYDPGDLQQNNFQRYHSRLQFDRIYRTNQTPFRSAGVGYHYFTNNWQTNEHNLDVNTLWELPKPIENHIVGGQINAFWLQTNRGVANFTTNQLNVQFFPTIKGKYNWLNYTLGINFNVFNVSQVMEGQEAIKNVTPYIFPEIKGEVIVVRDILSIFGGWSGDVKQNSTHSLMMQNPFILPEVALVPTAQNKIYAGLNGVLARNITFKAEAGINFVRDFALFYRSGDSLTTFFDGAEIPAFTVLYADGNYSKIRGELTYKIKNTDVGVFGELFNYNLKLDGNSTTPYHLPTTRVGVDARHRIKDKITVHGALAYLGGRQALDADGLFYEAKMKDIWDARLGINYNINNNISAAIDVHNLAAQQYDLWLGYGAQRARVMLSLMYKF